MLLLVALAFSLFIHAEGQKYTYKDGTIKCEGVAVGEEFYVQELGKTFTRAPLDLNDLSDDNFDYSSVCTTGLKDMTSMFSFLVYFDQNISHWDTSEVIHMKFMFYNAESFTHDLSKWDTSKVETMESMFVSAISFNKDISGWDTSKVTTMKNMFLEAEKFSYDISNWCVPNVDMPPSSSDYDNFYANSPMESKLDFIPKFGTCPTTTTTTTTTTTATTTTVTTTTTETTTTVTTTTVDPNTLLSQPQNKRKINPTTILNWDQARNQEAKCLMDSNMCMFKFTIPELKSLPQRHVVTLKLNRRMCSDYSRSSDPNIVPNTSITTENGIWSALLIFGECIDIVNGEARLFNTATDLTIANLAEKNTSVLEWYSPTINTTLSAHTGTQRRYNDIDFEVTLDKCRALWDLNEKTDLPCRINFLYKITAPCDSQLNGVHLVPARNPDGQCTFYTVPHINPLTVTRFSDEDVTPVVLYRLLGPYPIHIQDDINFFEPTNVGELDETEQVLFTNMSNTRRTSLRKALVFRNWTETGLLIYGADLVAYHYNGSLYYRRQACKTSANGEPSYYPPAADGDLLFYPDRLMIDPRPPNDAVNITLYVEPRTTTELFIRRWKEWDTHDHVVVFDSTCRF